jgi:hypothetical protein
VTITALEAPAFLQLGSLSDVEESRRLRLITQLRRAQLANNRQAEYYEGARQVRDLGIAIPPHLRDVEAVVAWPEIVVDVISERLRWRGWSAAEDLELQPIFEQNRLRVEVGQAVLDALIYGLSYLTVGTGQDGEPDVLVMPESPNRMTATWSRRLRRVTDALVELFDETGRLAGWKLYVPGETITAERRGGRLIVTDRDQHGLERVPVAVLRNRPRSERQDGRSEITRAVRSHTDNGMRTILGMEVAREFYGAPQRALMGADESMFVDEAGNPVGQWAAVIGKMLMAPRDENGDLPVPYTFTASSPQPYTDILRTLSQLVSAATGVPAHHLGFTTDNPASEGAIKRADERLDKRSEDRQEQFDLGLLELAELCVLWRDGELPAPEAGISSQWVPVSTVAPGAAADRATKMIAAGVLDPSWDFTLEQFGLSDDEITRVRRERLRGNGRSAISTLAAAADAARAADAQVADLTAADGSAAV